LRLRHKFVLSAGAASAELGLPASIFTKPLAQSCFVDGWQDAFLEQARLLLPFVANGTVVGIFFGDEVRSAAAPAPGRRVTLRPADKLLL
jgi:hypothetical protein